MNLTLRHFEIIEAVAEKRSIGRAASQLGLTQSAVTHALQALEEQVGTELFVRGRRGLEPTEAAKVFLQRNKNIRSSLDAIFNDIERIKRLETGTLMVAAGYWASAVSVELAFARLSLVYPGIAMELVGDTMRGAVARIASGEIDLGVMELKWVGDQTNFATEVLNTAQAYFFVRRGHPILRLRKKRLVDLALYPHVGSEWAPKEAEILAPYSGGFGYVDPTSGVMRSRITTRGFGTIRNIVVASDAIGLALKPMISADIEQGNLVTLDDPELLIIKAHYGFVWQKERVLSPILLAFMETVRKIEAEKCEPVDN
jgi:DNA-binding transcriptional LysR family regulator